MSCCDEEKNEECRKPEKLKDRPENCTPEQVKDCHGEKTEEHPCCGHRRG